LFGALAFEAGLINSSQFIEACTLWNTCRDVPLASLLIERGWILAADEEHLRYLLERRVRIHGGEPLAILAAAGDDVKRCLASLEDPEIQKTLTELGCPGQQGLDATAALASEVRERYSLARLHATGGAGRVWEAHDGTMGRMIALKELRPEKAHDAGLWHRFVREARITGQLEHPGIVPVYDLARRPHSQQPFYTMRFVKGKTLTHAARDYHSKRAAGKATSLEFLTMLNGFVAVCNTIAYSHSRGVIHRDLKGQNVILGDFGEVVVLDWGLAKLMNLPDDDVPLSIMSDNQGDNQDAADLTIEGQTIGTPAYMAPEQAAGRNELVGIRSDVYGLGAILYEILTGRPPFDGSSAREVLSEVCHAQPVAPSEVWADVPPSLAATCLRALSKTPIDRHGSASEMAQDVQNWQEVERRKAEDERDTFFTLSLDLLCTAGFDGYFKRLNPMWEKVLGFTKQELLGSPYLDFIHPDDRDTTINEAIKLRSGDELIFFENRYRSKDGSYRRLQWAAKPVPEQQLVVATARDVTERWRDEAALRESEERYRSVIASIDEGIIVMDIGGGIRTCNASAERILGLSAAQMMGRTPLDPRWRAIHEDGSPFSGDELPASVTLRTGEPCTNVVVGVHKPNEELTWISVNSRPLFRADANALHGVMASFSDITELKRIEARLRDATTSLGDGSRRTFE
jgi:PAS domain S-box-containing protein